jgi:hypothetical protein
MPIFPLTNEEKLRLQRLSQDKIAIFALKKLFMNISCKKPASNETIEKITEAFHELEIVQPDSETEEKIKNLI